MGKRVCSLPDEIFLRGTVYGGLHLHLEESRCFSTGERVRGVVGGFPRREGGGAPEGNFPEYRRCWWRKGILGGVREVRLGRRGEVLVS